MNAALAGLIELVAPSVCPACDAPRRTGATLLCSTCTRGARPLERVHGVRTALAYAETGRLLVQRWKFEGRRDSLQVIAALVAARLRALPIDALVAIPRHRARVRAEAAEPTHDLASAVARALHVPFVRRALVRSRATPPQTGQSRAARRSNVADSFTAEPGALAGLRVLLLDDVVTTGATLAEAARALRAKSGARRIFRCAAAGTPAMDGAAAPLL